VPHLLPATCAVSISALWPSGKHPTTCVLLRISRLIRSSGLLVRIRSQCSCWKRMYSSVSTAPSRTVFAASLSFIDSNFSVRLHGNLNCPLSLPQLVGRLSRVPHFVNSEKTHWILSAMRRLRTDADQRGSDRKRTEIIRQHHNFQRLLCIDDGQRKDCFAYSILAAHEPDHSFAALVRRGASNSEFRLRDFREFRAAFVLHYSHNKDERARAPSCDSGSEAARDRSRPGVAVARQFRERAFGKAEKVVLHYPSVLSRRLRLRPTHCLLFDFSSSACLWFWLCV
jgi:hypothetical protein